MTEGWAVTLSLGLAGGITGAILGAEIWYRLKRWTRNGSQAAEERAILRARVLLGS